MMALLLIPFMLMAVHSNTIVHPFLLADNRHYVFYVFRWFLLRYWYAKYLAVPAYFLCAWVILGALGRGSHSDVQRQGDSGPLKSPKTEGSTSKTAAAQSRAPTSARERKLRSSSGGVRASFVLIWLAASTLSIITAPLVEPRYFMIPWLIWRLHLPPSTSTSPPPPPSSPPKSSPPSSSPPSPPFPKGQDKPTNPTQHPIFQLRHYLHHWHHQITLWLETAWFLLINLVTCYVFLYRGFTWPQEPGQTQRFMW